MKVQNLINAWNLPDRNEDRTQLTLRLKFPTYAKLHALKAVYGRPVNDLINDILIAGLDEIIEALPKYRVTDPSILSDIAFHEGVDPNSLGPVYEGPRTVFDCEYKKILTEKSSEEINKDEAA